MAAGLNRRGVALICLAVGDGCVHRNSQTPNQRSSQTRIDSSEIVCFVSANQALNQMCTSATWVWPPHLRLKSSRKPRRRSFGPCRSLIDIKLREPPLSVKGVNGRPVTSWSLPQSLSSHDGSVGERCVCLARLARTDQQREAHGSILL